MGHTGPWLPERFVQLKVGFEGSVIDREITPRISEVRMWYSPMIYIDTGVSAESFSVVPELPTEGEEMGFQFSVYNRGEVGIGSVNVYVMGNAGGGEVEIRNESVYLPVGDTIFNVELISLEAGDHVIRISLELPMEVMDSNLLDNIFSAEVHVNAPPVAVISAPANAESHKEVVFDGSDSYDPDGNISNYSWDMGDETILSGPLVKHIYTGQKSFKVSLNVTDDSGFNVTVTQDILIGLPLPTVEIGILPGEGDITTDFLLYAVLFDPMDAVNEYTWVLPGGQERKGEQITWRFSDDGTHNISLIVGFGYEPREVGTWKHITVDNIPPSVLASTSSYEAAPGDEITFTSTGTHDLDDDMEQLSYRWDFGDGSFSTNPNERYAYSQAGWFKVNLTVTDDNGDANWTSFDIYIHTEYPVADFVIGEIYVNETARFYGSQSSDPDGTLVNYTWKLKIDATNDTIWYYGEVFSHVFSAPGNYTLNLTVRDNAGDEGSREKHFQVLIRDLDGDGIQDSDDPDIDGDGIPNGEDAYPMDPKKGGEEEGSAALFVVILVLLLLAAIVGVFLFLRARAKRNAGDEEDEMSEEQKEIERKRAYEEVYGGLEKKDGPGDDGGGYEDGDAEVEWSEPGGTDEGWY